MCGSKWMVEDDDILIPQFASMLPPIGTAATVYLRILRYSSSPFQSSHRPEKKRDSNATKTFAGGIFLLVRPCRLQP